MQSLLRGLGARSVAGANAGALGTSAVQRQVSTHYRGVASAGEADDGGHDANHAPFELVSHDEVEDVLEVLTNAGGRNLQVFERSSESDTDSTVSIGEDADRHIEAPFAAEYNGLLGRLLRNAQVQHAVLGALQTDPEFSYLADAAGARGPLMLPAIATETAVYVTREPADGNPLKELMDVVGRGLQRFGDGLAAVGAKLGDMFHELGEQLRRNIESLGGAHGEPLLIDGCPDPDAAAAAQHRAAMAGAIFQVAVFAVVLILAKRVGVVRFAPM